MSGYIEQLKQTVALRHAAAAAERARAARPLEDKIQEWWGSLPPPQRRTRYTMDELVRQFGAAPGRIGVALHRIGWTRHRRWRGGASYARYWVPAR